MLLTPQTKIRAVKQRPTRSATRPNDFQHDDLDEIGADCSAGDLTHGAASTTGGDGDGADVAFARGR